MSQHPLRTLFFGSSSYCLPILQSLQQKTTLVGIITREDKPVGRKKLITPSPPKEFGNKANISVFTPQGKTELLSIKDTLIGLGADIAIVADYGIIIPEEIFTVPRLQTVNVHFSKLPDLRGASPVQFTILRGDTHAWITIQMMEQTLDTGAIVWNTSVALTGNETTEALYKKLFTIAAQHLPNILFHLADGKISPLPQNDQQATYTRRLTREDGYLPYPLLLAAGDGQQATTELLATWPLYTTTLSALTQQKLNLQQQIDAVLRAFSPWPGLWTTLPDGRRLIIHAVELQHISSLQPRTKLVPTMVQVEGKHPISWDQFIHNR